VLFEVTVRCFLPVSDFFWAWDPAIGIKLVPGLRGVSVKTGMFNVPVQVNSIGFRDREHTINKQTGMCRVVLVGDSFVEALQVRFEESITAQLESQLRSHGKNCEVISFGVSGAGTAREYLALREYGLKYKPDLVLLLFVGNDFSDNSKTLKSD